MTDAPRGLDGHPSPRAAPPIVLRPWGAQDRPAILEIFANTDDLDTQYPLPVTELDDAGDVLERMLGWDESRRNLAITVGGAPVGNVAVTAVDRRHDTGWMSYFSASVVRGRGLVTRSAITVARWALSSDGPAVGVTDGPITGAAAGTTGGPTARGNLSAGLGLYRLELGHRVNNPASGRIAVAAGFVLEGRERAKLRHGDQRFDTLTYGRLVTDPAQVAIDVFLEI